MASKLKGKEKTRMEITLGRIAALKHAGFTPTEIATAVEIPESTVSSILDKYGPAMDKVYQNKA